MTTAHRPLLAPGIIERKILVLRRHRVILDEQLAPLYGVEVKVLNQAVKRNRERFPEDFMFQLTAEETALLRSQSVTLDAGHGRGAHRKYRPYAFTEQGVAMLSSVLRSPRAVQVNIEIMRAFVRLRRMLQENADLARKLAALEKKYDAQFKVVFDAIRELMEPPVQASRPIGFTKKSEPS
ncbi:ORF6N domain-containing protein [Anaeromyxobacter terrae]|uniref:ORF6N domain-containing protein n=1 Tax=Anaeromyxobacter terrae TaxID=2925406 RepID=UPI001F5A3A45|nr:ORF6N domain-containing protein [Anaeromyxobacter sp. SG22]